MPAILLLLFPLGLATVDEDEDWEVAFLVSFPSGKQVIITTEVL